VVVHGGGFVAELLGIWVSDTFESVLPGSLFSASCTHGLARYARCSRGYNFVARSGLSLLAGGNLPGQRMALVDLMHQNPAVGFGAIAVSPSRQVREIRDAGFFDQAA
jgi:hypothetical protein